jgi:transcriptional regulator
MSSLYSPTVFRVDERATLLARAAAHPFATVITHSDGTLAVSHLPLLIDAEREILRGHVARGNPQLAHFTAGAEALAIFHGPHGYVSPSVYEDQPSVPTWNYVVVHARGRARPVDAAVLREILDDMVARFDTTGWRLDGPEEFVRSKLEAIAGFEIQLASVEGKWKISQNRSLADQRRVIAWLERGDESSKDLAGVMRAHLDHAPV